MAPLPPRPSPTVEAIFAAYEAEAEDGLRPHLGASEIGRDCRRALWYGFRWAARAAFPGRILRLFETGQREEERLIRNLRRIGATVLDLDPETGRQWRVSALGNHFGGSLDAVALGIPEAPKTWHVVEFKTHSARSFAALRKDGVRTAKPDHFAQMQIYMHLAGLIRALYMAVCKDTDDLFTERVRAEGDVAEGLIAKAESIIGAARPPARISDDPAWFQCRLCRFHALCHEGAAAERNCRTCLHSTPVEGGWHCERHNQPLSVARQKQGCADHLYIPDLVAGEVVDADDHRVVYRLPDGAQWTDGRMENVPC
ncbi:MAG: hypothetical protein Kow00104_01200 [Rhodothalassiaceae bacterium]